MKKIAVVLLLLSGPAFATWGSNPQGGDAEAEADATAVAGAAAIAGASSNNENTVKNNIGIKNDNDQVTVVGLESDDDLYQTFISDDDVSVTSIDASEVSNKQGQAQEASNATSITDNSSYTYKQPPAAFAGFSQNVIQGCSRILGFDFRGADNDGAGGASFGLPLADKGCQLDKATAQAFALGNYEMGWKLYCAQKAVWKGYQTVQRAETGHKPSKLQAIRGCIDTGRTVSSPPPEQVVIREEIDTSEFATKQEVSDTVEKAFRQSLVK